MVLMILQPRGSPAAIAVAQLMMTHKGTWNSVRRPAPTKLIVIIPIDFWASLEPCENDIIQAENTCSAGKPH